MNRDYMIIAVDNGKLKEIKNDAMDKIVANIGGYLIHNTCINPDDIEVTLTTEEDIVSSFIGTNFLHVPMNAKKDTEMSKEEAAIVYVKTCYVHNRFDRKKFLNDLMRSILGDDKKLVNAVEILGTIKVSDKIKLSEKYHLSDYFFEQMKLAYTLVTT